MKKQQPLDATQSPAMVARVLAVALEIPLLFGDFWRLLEGFGADFFTARALQLPWYYQILATRRSFIVCLRMLIAFNKPYGVISQFTPDGSPYRTLAEFGFPKCVYPIGRLDADSEGLLLLSEEPELNQRLLHPRHAHEREYWVQVERVPAAEALRQLGKGLVIQGRKTLPCRARMLQPQPEMPPRQPPVRFRKTVPTCWLAMELTEGKNRQVRRMTSAIGHPTLRLMRVRIGQLELANLEPGKWKILSDAERKLVLAQ